MKKLVSILMILAMIVPLAGAQSTDIFKKKKKKKSKTEAVDKAKADSIAKSKKDALQPYAKVITGKAKTMDGFFKVHYVDGKYFFEIADSLFGRDILIVNRVVKAPVDAQKRKVGYPGDYISDEVIRFEKGRGDKLFVREISYLEHSADTLGMYQAVLNSNVQPIVATFPLKTVRKEGETTNYVIDMTDYIRKDNEMFSFTSRVKDNIGASSMVDDASYIDTLKAFPQNIEIRTVRTFQRKKGGGSGLEKLLAAFFATSTTPLTYELNSSMLLLPKEPMKPRLHDDRVGYFAVSYKDFDENPQYLFGKVLGKVVEFVVLTLEIHDYKAVELIYLAHIHNICLLDILTAVKIARYRLGNSVRHARNLVYDSKLAAVEFFLPYIICYDRCLLRTADNVLGEGIYNKALHSTLRL